MQKIEKSRNVEPPKSFIIITVGKGLCAEEAKLGLKEKHRHDSDQGYVGHA